MKTFLLILAIVIIDFIIISTSTSLLREESDIAVCLGTIIGIVSLIANVAIFLNFEDIVNFKLKPKQSK